MNGKVSKLLLGAVLGIVFSPTVPRTLLARNVMRATGVGRTQRMVGTSPHGE
jgi:hypothetical protein